MVTTESITKIREAKKLTQVELSAIVGISQSALSMYETGQRKPSIDIAVRIAQALGCTVDDLIQEKEPA